MKKLFTTVLAILLCVSAFAQFKTSKQDRAYWNGFIDYLYLKGVKGSVSLNRKDLNIAEKLFCEYNKANGRSMEYTTFVTLVQSDILVYRQQALEQIKISRIKHAQDARYPLMFDGSDEEFMPGLSAIDGFAGVQTTSWKFPSEVVQGITYVKTNDVYVSNKR